MISVSNIKARQQKIRDYLSENGWDGIAIVDPYNIFYLFDFFHVPTERPVICFIAASGDTAAFVPAMEVEEASRNPQIDRVESYFEYPGKTDVHGWISESIRKLYGVENLLFDTLSLSLYRKLSPDFKKLDTDRIVGDMRLTKDEEEVECLLKSGMYSDYIVTYGFEHVKPGMSELEILSDMKAATTKKMIADMGEIIFVPGGPTGGLVPSGRRTGLPHALPSAKIIEKGDPMILSCGANVHGYSTECERTIFIGEPDSKMIEAFEVMAEAQVLGLSLMKAGAVCSQIDDEVLDFIRMKGYGDYIKHRIGHGKGLQKHEPPWVESGDTTVLKPGMVLSSEPGIYMEGFAGFRHSDTIVVTEGEPLILTHFPKDLENLIVRI